MYLGRIASLCFFFYVTTAEVHPDAGLSMFQILEKYEYPLENHTVKTEDGYLLGVHRIRHGRKNGKSGGAPVFLMHGTLCASHDWIINGPNWSLGLILADLGYDVWMGNQRGNMYSRRHVTLDPDRDSEEFFDFSFHEIGLYDISAMINYILNATKQEKLHYVGHSQGVTSFAALLSMKSEYNEKVYELIALAPAVFMNRTTTIMSLGTKQIIFYEFARKYLGYQETFAHSDFSSKMTKFFCTHTENFCTSFMDAILGSSPGELDKEKLPVYTTNTPAGASVKQLLHYLKAMKSGYFRQYDYGEEENLRRYGRISPPEYDVKNLKTKVFIFYSDQDGLTNWKNVEQLAHELPRATTKLIRNYNHIDFLWGIHATDNVYSTIIEIFRNESSQAVSL